jgi:hypothetical protein
MRIGGMASRTIINKIREGIERKDRRSNRPEIYAFPEWGKKDKINKSRT